MSKGVEPQLLSADMNTNSGQTPLAMADDRGETLPSLLSRAAQRLLDARHSGEVLEAKRLAELALHLARVTKAANETHADCLRIITRAESRMADEIDAAQKKGELACVGRPQMVRGADNSSPARLRDLGVPRQRIAEWREVRDAGDQVVQEAIEEALLEGRAPTKADIARRIRGPKDAGEHEWETPVEFVDAVRSVLGEIDLDPASSRHAQETIRAGRYFTKETDGLAHDWKGRVWLNPPQQEPQILDFADKMVAQLVCGNVAVAIMLTPNSTDMAWFQKLSLYAKAICFPRGRVRFVTPDGSLAAPRHGQAIFYFGDDVPAFASAFKEIGFVLVSFRACRPAASLNGARPRPSSGCVPKDVAPGADAEVNSLASRSSRRTLAHMVVDLRGKLRVAQQEIDQLKIEGLKNEAGPVGERVEQGEGGGLA